MKISIIIVTYNSIDFIVDCINSIKKYFVEDPEIIIVDNSEEPENIKLFEFLNENYGEELIKIKNKNLGYGHGNNVGIKDCSGDIVCIMNPDVRFSESITENIRQEFKDPRLGLLGYKQMGGENLSFYSKPEYSGIFTGPIIKLANKFDLFNSKYLYLSGALMFFCKEKLESVGSFDNNLFMYFEEPDISNRLRKMGYKIKYNGKIKYIHLVGKREQYSETAFNIWIKSLKYYLTKYNLDHESFYFKKIREYKFRMLLNKRNQTKLIKIRSELERFKNSFNN